MISKRFPTRIFLLLIPLFVSNAQAQIITTVAGNGLSAGPTDGVPATTAIVTSPTRICTDRNGNLIIVTTTQVQKVAAATGIITTICGNGTGEDGGLAINAALRSPFGICVDGSGNIYLAEVGRSKIRKIDGATGIITTVVGTGTFGSSGDGGPATQATLRAPYGCHVDKYNNLYIADGIDHRIRKVDLNTGIISTLAGNGVRQSTGDSGPAINASLATPVSVCSDTSGNVYIAEADLTFGCRIRKIDKNSGIITTVAGNSSHIHSGDGGLARTAGLGSPTGVCTDAYNNIYISENLNHTIRKVNSRTGIITTIAGTSYAGFAGDGGPALEAKLFAPMDVNIDNGGNLYIADRFNNRIRKIETVACLPTIAIEAPVTCPGEMVPFTATTTHSGSTPGYQWSLNGAPVGGNNAMYSGHFQNGDVVACTLTSSAGCAVEQTVTSMPFTLTYTPQPIPEVTITASRLAACPGQIIEFRAVNKNSNDNPSYQWQVNGLAVGTNENHFAAASLQNGDVIRCIMTVPACSGSSNKVQVLSNALAIEIIAEKAPEVSIRAGELTVCTGGSVTLIAENKSNHPSPVYQWLVNTIPTGGNQEQLPLANIQDLTTIQCILNVPHCTSGSTKAYSNIVSIQPISPPLITFSPATLTVEPGQQATLQARLSGPYSRFTWSPASALVSGTGLIVQTIPLHATTRYTLSVSTQEGCSAQKEVVVTVFQPVYMADSFTPNGDGKNEVFRIPSPTSVTLTEFAVFNRWGQKIFTTTDSTKGWDGSYKGQPAPAGTYSYLISGSQFNEPLRLKGTVQLLR